MVETAPRPEGGILVRDEDVEKLLRVAEGGDGFPQVLAKLHSPWAIEEDKHEIIVKGVLELLAKPRAERRAYIEDLRADYALTAAPAPASGPRVAGGIAVVPLRGTIFARTGAAEAVSGGQSLQAFREQMREAASDPAIGSIVIDVDSFGGTVDMVQETAEFVRSLGKEISITAVANTIAASAAFWIAAQAGELVITPSGQVGSVGIVAKHEDHAGELEAKGIKMTVLSTARFKTEGSQAGPLSDAAQEHRLGMMAEFHAQFESDLAKGRGAPIATVRRNFGEGRMVLAADAVERGMADRVATLEDVLRGLGARGRGRPRNATAMTQEELAGSALDELLVGGP